MPPMNSLKKGKISICDEKGNPSENIGFTFNPSSYRISSRPHYREVKHLTQDTEKKEFLGGVSRTLSVTLFFDSFSDRDLFSASEAERVKDITAGIENKLPPITDKLKKLEKAAHVAGEQHKPPRVIFSWGNLNFKGIITEFNAEYTMFSMEGKPIRATVSLSISEEKDAPLRISRPHQEQGDRGGNEPLEHCLRRVR